MDYSCPRCKDTIMEILPKDKDNYSGWTEERFGGYCDHIRLKCNKCKLELMRVDKYVIITKGLGERK